MKLLHVADLHIGKIVNEFSMLEDQKYIFGADFTDSDCTEGGCDSDCR